MAKGTSTGGQVEVGGRLYDLSVEDEQVRVHLPTRVDPHSLTSFLVKEGYPLSHDPDEVTDSQGWGPAYDSQGYYRWWVYPDPEQAGGSCFAFNPRPDDLVRQGESATAQLSVASQQDLERWVPVLERFGTAR